MTFPVPCIAAAASRSGRVGALSGDTSLGTFSIAGAAVAHGNSIQKANAVTSVYVIAIPTHAGATLTINGSPVTELTVSIALGDNTVTVSVTAENGVTTQNHVVTVRRLTAGVKEQTSLTFGDPTGWVTTLSALYLDISDVNGVRRFWGNTGTEGIPASSGTVSLHEVNFSSADVAADVCAYFYAVITSALFNPVGISANECTLEDLTSGVRTDATTNGPVTINVIANGEASS